MVFKFSVAAWVFLAIREIFSKFFEVSWKEADRSTTDVAIWVISSAVYCTELMIFPRVSLAVIMKETFYMP